MYVAECAKSWWLTVLQNPEKSEVLLHEDLIFLKYGIESRIAGHSSWWRFSLSFPLYLERVLKAVAVNLTKVTYWWTVRRWKLWGSNYLRLVGEGKGNRNGWPLTGRADFIQIMPLLASLRSSWDVFIDQFYKNRPNTSSTFSRPFMLPGLGGWSAWASYQVTQFL